MEKKRKFKISGKLIFNILVFAVSVYFIVFFFVSEDGMIDLLKSPDGINLWWVFAGIVAFYMNIIMDSIVTLVYLRSNYPQFRFIDSVKVACVGVFFGAITPSNTGGQPMQLYLMSKMDVSVGFGSACMTQKFIVYQIVTTSFSIFAVIYKFDYFSQEFTSFWSSAFIVLGFLSQIAVTVFFLIVSFSKKLTGKLLRLIYMIMKSIKFIKNPTGKIRKIAREFNMFHKSNKMLMTNPKRLIVIFLLVFVQVMLILSVPYFVYLSFGMPKIAASHGIPAGNLFDFICIQSFVLFTSNLVPLPGASGGAELAFTMYFGSYFVIGSIRKIKPAILLWRFITYYSAIILTLPFSFYTKGKNKDEEYEKKLEAEGADHEEEFEIEEKVKVKKSKNDKTPKA